ncbi:MAG TPA: hypothetical protein VF655_11000 [Allosphingosinicella sp.]|jgi:hypothetical protein
MALLFLSAALAALGGQAPAPAAPVPMDQVSPEHAPAELDRLLAEHDYLTLGARIREVSRQADLVSDLDWLKNRTIEGNSAFVAMLYSRLLWGASEQMPEAPKREWRTTAAMMTLYAQAAINIDGARCGDRSAPAHRGEQLLGWNREVWPFIASLTPEEQRTLVEVAVMVEQKTAPRRDAAGDLDFLCRGGLEETQYNLTHGSAREVPKTPGTIGRQIVLSGDGKYKPSERPEAEWRAEASAKRAKLGSDLEQVIAAFTSARVKLPKPD